MQAWYWFLLICFKINFMKIEFQNTIRRLNFLCHLTDIKIAWINPCIAKSFIELSVNVLGNHWATETLTAFSISKSLQVLKKNSHQDSCPCYLHLSIFLYIHTLLSCWKKVVVIFVFLRKVNHRQTIVP